MNDISVVWSNEYDAKVSSTYAKRKPKNNTKLDLTKCTILITEFGFFYLKLKDRTVKQINFNQFMTYKKYVKEIVNEGYPII